MGVIRNKSDLFLEQEVDENKAIEFAEKNGGFFELISAKENKIGLDNYITKLFSIKSAILINVSSFISYLAFCP